MEGESSAISLLPSFSCAHHNLYNSPPATIFRLLTKGIIHVYFQEKNSSSGLYIGQEGFVLCLLALSIS
jgi:hypothetical protein